MRRSGFMLCLLLAGFLLFPVKAQAWYFWFFDEPLAYQSFNLTLVPKDPKENELDSFVGRRITLAHATKDAPVYTFDIGPNTLLRKRMFRFLAPRVIQGSYTISVTGMAEGEKLVPEKVEINGKTNDLLIQYVFAKPEGESKESKGEKSKPASKQQRESQQTHGEAQTPGEHG